MNSLMESFASSMESSPAFDYNYSDNSDSVNLEVQDLDLKEYKNIQKDMENLHIPPFVIEKEDYDIMKIPETRIMLTANQENNRSDNFQIEIQDRHEGDTNMFNSRINILCAKIWLVVYIIFMSIFLYSYYYLDKKYN